MTAAFSATSTAEVGKPNHTASAQTGVLIVNADDWGRDRATTDRIFECVSNGSVSSASAMVYMEDSERSAEIALERRVSVGLHLNFTTPFSSRGCPPRLIEEQRKVTRFLRGNKLAQVVYHPGLADAFRYVVDAQVDEFERIYGVKPERVDGHHHMHLCANVLLGKLLPEGTIARRNFSFAPGEKSGLNRRYRGVMDRLLRKRHTTTDYFFSLPPIEPRERVERIFSLARESAVEVECHPVNPEEYKFLAGGEIFRYTGGMPIAKSYRIHRLTNS